MRPAFRPHRVLLTGASGAIGGIIGPALLAAGIPLRVLVHRRHPAWIPPGSVVEERRGDVLVPSTLRGAVDGCDAVVHAAARPGFGVLDRDRQRRINVEGTDAALQEAESSGARLFALVGYTGTVQERGDAEVIDEETPPQAEYDSATVRMKMESEALTLESNRPGSFRTMVASPGILFGPGFRSPLSELARLYLRQELPYRLLESVWLALSGPRDVGEGIVAAIERGRGGHRYFLTGACVRMRELYALLGERSGVPAPRRRLPDLLVEELGLIAPLLPPHSFLRRLVLPRELVLHLRRLAPLRNERTRTELGITPQPLEELIDGLVREAGVLPRGGAFGAG
ncbi:MAG: NAD-dependent epimerase/dehydratase family protein [Candidatus Eisenbacteria bacterium]